MQRASIFLGFIAAVRSALSGDGAFALRRLSGGLDRPVYSAAPLSLNTSENVFVLDPSIKLVGDWDVRDE